jgi:hypothetical protein
LRHNRLRNSLLSSLSAKKRWKVLTIGSYISGYRLLNRLCRIVVCLLCGDCVPVCLGYYLSRSGLCCMCLQIVVNRVWLTTVRVTG